MKKWTAMLLLICLVLGMLCSASPALAESCKVYVASNTLKIYAKASSSAKVLGTMSYGEKMLCLDVNDGWAQVQNSSGATGFCKKGGLTTDNPNNMKKEVCISKAGVKIYDKPTGSSSVLMKVSDTSEIYTAVAKTPDGEWVRLKNGKYYGYVASEYVVSASEMKPEKTQAPEEPEATATPEAEPTPTPEAGENTEQPSEPEVTNTPEPEVTAEPTPENTKAPENEGEKVWVSNKNLKVYKKANTSSKQLGVVCFGESMILLSVDGEWAKVQNSANGSTGFCKLSGLTKENPNKEAVDVYAAQDGVKVMDRPSASANKIASLNKGESIPMVAVTGDELWVRVQVNGGYGYIETAYLSKKPVEADKPSESQPGESEPGKEEPKGETAYVIKEEVFIYAEADSAAAVIASLVYGESTELLEVEGSWAKVRTGSGVGYCSFSALTDEDPNSFKIPMEASVDGAKVYAKPAKNSTVIAELDKEAKMSMVSVIIGTQWVRVKLAGGEYGFMTADSIQMSAGGEDIVEPDEPEIPEQPDDPVEPENPGENEQPDEPVEPEKPEEPENPGAASAAEAIIQLAKKQLGDPYVYSANGPDSFDCSGFVYYCFKEITGIKLKRTAYAQGYDESYKKISDPKDLKPGDLVFFDTNSDDADLSDHSGIYVGGGKFVHASSAAGKVITSNMSSGYYARTFSWGRRVL